ncbi:MAG: SBBP repeat-containing protein [Candidatus Sulfotelmatobacter sp.]
MRKLPATGLAAFFLMVVAALFVLALAVQGHKASAKTGAAARSGAVATLAQSSGTPDEPLQHQVREAMASAPMNFEANQGQTDKRVKFLARGAGYALFLTSNGAVMAFPHPSATAAKPQLPPAPFALPRVTPVAQSAAAAPQRAESVLNMRIVGGNTAATVTGLDKQEAESNYFIGNDPEQWHRRVPNYGKVKYAGVYPGVDLVYYGNQKQLEYDFVVAPGADPKRIELTLGSGPEGQAAIPVRIDQQGNLVATLDGDDVQFHKPVIYQPATAASGKAKLDGKFVLKGNGRVGFEISAYDRNRELVIDPVLSYSTYIGGSNEDIAYGVTYGVRYGQPIIVGSTRSADFPIALQLYTYHPGTCGAQPCRDLFVSKWNPTLSKLIFSTYVGGSNDEVPFQVTQDVFGDIFLTGYTLSTDFPIRGPVVQKTFGGGTVTGDAFIVQVESAGFYLEWSTYIGGSGDDVGYSIQVDAPGNSYVAGTTTSLDFPTTSGAYQTSCGLTQAGTCSTAFLSVVNIPGKAYVYSTYLGGSGGLGEAAYGVALDSNANAYVAGITGTPNFPTTAGALKTTCGTDTLCNGSYDGFVSKVNSAGTALLYSTFLGGSGYDYLSGIAVDASGNAYVAGGTTSSDFPVSATAPQKTYGGASAGCIPTSTTICGDVTVSKLNATGSKLTYSTYLGGSGDESPGFSMAIDTQGDAFVTGFTNSANFPQVSPMQTFGGGSGDAFLTKINPGGTAFLYSTYLGGNGWDFGYHTATDPSGNVYVAGGTTSTNFKLTAHATQNKCGTDGTCNGGLADAFFVKVIVSADMSITKKESTTMVKSGAMIKYQLNATNNGPDPAATVAVSDTTPTGTTFSSVTTNGGTCTAPPVGGTGTVTCTMASVPTGSHIAITLTLTVTAAAGATITNTASVSASTFDPVATNNSATVSATVD